MHKSDYSLEAHVTETNDEKHQHRSWNSNEFYVVEAGALSSLAGELIWGDREIIWHDIEVEVVEF